MSHSPIHETIFEQPNMSERPLTNHIAEIGVVALIGLGLALLGPFGTDALPLANRFFFWITGMLIAWAVFRVIVLGMREFTRLIGISEVFSYLLAIPLLSGVIMIAQTWFGDETSPANQSLWTYVQILGLGTAFFVLFWLIYYRAETRMMDTQNAQVIEDQPTPNSSGLINTALHGKLPAGFGPITALSVEDHYVKVHSEQRSEMLLMKLSEAIGLMDSTTGMQVHRSWWVAISAIQSAKRVGRNIQLELNGNLHVPVSRANVPHLREAGLLD